MRYFKADAYLEVIYEKEAVVYDQKDGWQRRFALDFDIKMSRSKTPNQGIVAIYNLSADTRQRIERDAKSIRVFAGYDDNFKLIFTGDVVFVNSSKNTADWKTEIRAGDGWRSFSQSITSRNYAAGTPIRTIVEQTAKDMGIALKESANILKGVISGSLTLDGRSKDALDDIVNNHGGQWSIQDSELQVTPITKPIDGEAIVLAADSGLLETPTVTQKGVNVRSQLHPDIRPGKVIELKASSWTIEAGGSGAYDGNTVHKATKKQSAYTSKKEQSFIQRGYDYSGFYITQSVQFVGNNYGGPFDCRIEAIRYNP